MSFPPKQTRYESLILLNFLFADPCDLNTRLINLGSLVSLSGDGKNYKGRAFFSTLTQDDSDCPDWLMCNQWQNRCTECVDNKDCPACLNDDCPFPGEGVCVYGDHCCTPSYC